MKNAIRKSGRPCILVLFVVFGIVLSFGCGIQSEEKNPVPDRPAVRVEVLRVESSTVRETMVASAVAEAKVDYRVSAEVEGVLVHQNVDRGDRVEKGQILFEIEKDEFRLRQRDRAARFAQAEARLKFMEQELRRKEPLYQNDTLSQAHWDQLQFDLKAAQAERDQAHVALEQADRDWRLATVRSPITGIVLDRFRKSGEVVPKGTVLAWIADPSKVVFETGLSDRELGFVRVGDAVEVRIDAVPGQVFSGRISSIPGNTDPRTGTFPVEVAVDNSNGTILPGMVGRFELPGQLHRNRIIIPLMAVEQRLGGTVVYLIKEGMAVKRSVSLGRVLGELVVVEDGLASGELLVVVSQGRVRDGAPVTIVEKSAGAI
jgi:membrane fusion protein, multidrug efflux system